MLVLLPVCNLTALLFFSWPDHPSPSFTFSPFPWCSSNPSGVFFLQNREFWVVKFSPPMVYLLLFPCTPPFTIKLKFNLPSFFEYKFCMAFSVHMTPNVILDHRFPFFFSTVFPSRGLLNSHHCSSPLRLYFSSTPRTIKTLGCSNSLSPPPPGCGPPLLFDKILLVFPLSYGRKFCMRWLYVCFFVFLNLQYSSSPGFQKLSFLWIRPLDMSSNPHLPLPKIPSHFLFSFFYAGFLYAIFPFLKVSYDCPPSEFPCVISTALAKSPLTSWVIPSFFVAELLKWCPLPRFSLKNHSLFRKVLTFLPYDGKEDFRKGAYQPSLFSPTNPSL